MGKKIQSMQWLKHGFKIKNSYWLFLMILCATVQVKAVQSITATLPKTAYHHNEILGPNGTFSLEWMVDFDAKSIQFNISASCRGYVGIGLSKTGVIEPGTDFVVGGIDTKGKAYFSDMHGIINGSLERDSRQDWKLLNAHKADGRSYLSFYRQFETCDEEDYTINEDLIKLLWAYGDTDEITLFPPFHGVYPVYLLDPNLSDELAMSIYRQVGPHSSTLLMQRWRAVSRQRVPPRTTSHMCSIIKGPSLGYKHYILGGGAYLPHEAKKHVTQIILSKCYSPNNTAAGMLFEPFVQMGSEECYFQDNSTLPQQLCTEKIFVWGRGGKPFYFPDDIGIPIGTSMNEYYMLAVTFHNPANLGDLELKTGLDLMFHPAFRAFEAGILNVNYGLHGLFTIPPRSTAFNIFGHCSSACTTNMFAGGETKVLAVLLKMGDSGLSIRLRHFRNNTELPWILKDGNYHNQYQQIRLLSREITILPGDHIIVQCTYDTSGSNITRLSGFTSDDEQCLAYLFVNQPVSNAWCSSEYSSNVQLQRFGVQNFTWNNVNGKRVVTSATPKSFVGELLSDITDKSFRWSPSVRTTLQQEMQYGQQSASCPSHKIVQAAASDNRSSKSTKFIHQTPFSVSTVKYPSVSLEYKQFSECQRAMNLSDFGYGYRHALRSSSRNRSFPTTSPATSTTTVTTSTPNKEPLFGNRIANRLSRINFSRRVNGSDTEARVKALLLKIHISNSNSN